MAKKKRRAKTRNKLLNGIGRDLAKSTELAKTHLPISDLSRVDASRPQETQNLINQKQALSDPFSAAYAGKRTGQLQEYVGSLNDARAGYDSRELTALRDQRRRETERGFQSGRASLARQQNNFRTGGTQRAAQMLELAKGYGQAGADAENDLFIAGAEEKRRANTQYGDTVAGLEQTEFDRGQAALKSYSDSLGTAQADQLEREKINLAQEAADKASQGGAALGILQMKEARQNAKKQNKLIREGYKSNERIAGRSSSGTTANAGTSYADELNKLAEQYR